jgi:(2Fe-2S) ferredoxin
MQEHGLTDSVTVMPVDCMDICEHGPVVRLLPDKRWLRGVNAAAARQLAERLANEKGRRKK